MKKIYVSPLAEIIRFQPEEDVMSNNETLEGYMSSNEEFDEDIFG